MPNNIRLRTYKSGKQVWEAQDRTPGFRAASAVFPYNRKREAMEWCARMKIERQRGHQFDPAQATSMTLEDAIRKYVELRTPRKAGAQQERSLAARWLKHPLAARDIGKVVPLDLDAYVTTRLGDGIAGSTVKKELSFISEVYNFVRRKLMMYAVNNPVPDVDKPKCARGRTRRLTADEMKRLMHHLSTTGNPEMFYVFSVAMETGLRKSELLRLRWEDISFDTRLAEVEQARKGRHPESMPSRRCFALTEHAVTLFGAFRAASGRKADGCVFKVTPNAIDMATKRAREAAEISDWRFHDCRHEAASRLIAANVPLEIVRQQLGHRNLHMTQRYSHSTPQEMVAAISKVKAPAEASVI